MPITTAKDFNYIIIILLAKMWRLLFSWQRKPSETEVHFYRDNRKKNLLPSIHHPSIC